MFNQKQSFFTQLTRTYPVLKLVDISDRQSFVREYVLDNVYFCIFAYLLFYAALWYANRAIKRVEKTNEKLMNTVISNRTKLDDVMALKDKRAEYEDIVVKAKSAQKVTARHLDNEMKRLSTELVATGNKIAELETVLAKMLCSVNFGEKSGSVAKQSMDEGKERNTKGQRLSRTPSRMSRSSNRHFHQRCHRNRRHGSTVSLSRDHRANVHPRSTELQRRKSDSSNRGSAETSSNDSRLLSLSRVTSMCHWHPGCEHGRCRSKKRSRRISTMRKASSNKKLSLESFTVVQPFAKSALDAEPILSDNY